MKTPKCHEIPFKVDARLGLHETLKGLHKTLKGHKKDLDRLLMTFLKPFMCIDTWVFQFKAFVETLRAFIRSLKVIINKALRRWCSKLGFLRPSSI